jgi:hypothetical protein
MFTAQAFGCIIEHRDGFVLPHIVDILYRLKVQLWLIIFQLNCTIPDAVINRTLYVDYSI